MSLNEKMKSYIYRKFPKHVQIPVLGAPGCGKTTFLAALGKYVCIKKIGIIGDKNREKFYEIFSPSFNNPTTGLTEFTIILQKSPKTKKSIRNIIFDTGDISGRGYLKRTENYYNAIKKSGGVIIILDVVKGFSHRDKERIKKHKIELLELLILEKFQSAKEKIGEIVEFFASQLQPTLNSLIEISELRKMKNKTINLIISKQDIHILPPDLNNKISKILYERIKKELKYKNVKVYGPYLMDARKIITNHLLDENDKSLDLMNEIINKITFSIVNA